MKITIRRKRYFITSLCERIKVGGTVKFENSSKFVSKIILLPYSPQDGSVSSLAEQRTLTTWNELPPGSGTL